MKNIFTIGLSIITFAMLAGCTTNESVSEGDEISEEEQQKIQDIIDADQANLNE